MAVVYPGKFIYLATLNTGSMAIATGLKKIDGAYSAYDKRHGIGHMATLDQVKEVCGDKLTGTEVIFTGVRNPYDLLVSWMFDHPTHMHVRRWEAINKREIDLRGFLEVWLEFNPFPYFKDGRVFHQTKDCSKVVHYEKLQAELNSVIRKIPGLPGSVQLPGATEQIPRDHWSTFYDDPTYAFVNEHFQQEFVQFGYPFVWSANRLA